MGAVKNYYHDQICNTPDDEWWADQDNNEQWIAEYTSASNALTETTEDENMTVIVKDKGGSDFKKVPPGNHIAVCNMVVALGIQPTNFGDKSQVYLRWEIPGERTTYMKDGVEQEGPMIIGCTYTASLSSKANLRHDLTSWRGRDFTKEELEAFDLNNILGAPCMLNVVHNTADNGNVYANIASIAQLPKGMPKPVAELPLITYGEDDTGKFDQLPEWLQNKITDQIKVEDAEPDKLPADADFDDDIPF